MTMKTSLLLMAFAMPFSSIESFSVLPNIGKRTCRMTLNYRDLPTIHDVSTDEFTEQVYHASAIVRELSTKEKEEELTQLLKAQLSHFDGMRGFFAAYLAADQQETDNTNVPSLLLNVLKGSNFEILAPLACMNLITPVAMACVHSDPVLAANSRIVGQRTKKLLVSFKSSINIARNCDAILAVASGNAATTHADKKLVQFWGAVFDYNEYSAEQKRDVVQAFKGIA